MAFLELLVTIDLAQSPLCPTCQHLRRHETAPHSGDRGDTDPPAAPHHGRALLIPCPLTLPGGCELRSSHSSHTIPAPPSAFGRTKMAAVPEGRGRARWAGLPSRAAPARGRARLHFRLPAAASGPPFLGNNGAENGRLSGQEAARRRSGTGRARTAGTQPRAVRAAAHPQPGGRRRAAAAGGEHRGGGGLSKWPGEGRGPGPGEAAAASARSGRRERGPSAPARGRRGGSAGRGRLHRRCREGAGGGDGGPGAGVPGWAALVTPGHSPGRRHPDPPPGAGAGCALPPGRAGGPGTVRLSGGIGRGSFWEGGGGGGCSPVLGPVRSSGSVQEPQLLTAVVQAGS